MCLCFKHQPKHKWSLLTEDGTGYSFSLRLFCAAGLIKTSVVKNSFQSTESLSRNWLLGAKQVKLETHELLFFEVAALPSRAVIPSCT